MNNINILSTINMNLSKRHYHKGQLLLPQMNLLS